MKPGLETPSLLPSQPWGPPPISALLVFVAGLGDISPGHLLAWPCGLCMFVAGLVDLSNACSSAAALLDL
jgi:hypothetical protein